LHGGIIRRLHATILEEGAMDWLEKWFGVSPDGGDGSAEMMIFAAIVIVLAGVLALRVPSVRTHVRQWFGGRPSHS
jgi:hypothetical protein